MLTRFLVVCALSAPGFAQDDPVRSISEITTASLAGMRGGEDYMAKTERLLPVTTPVVFAQAPHGGPGDRAAGPAVSAARLRHKIPASAQKAFTRATRLTREGNTESAIAEYRRSIMLDPDYVEAHCDLAVLYQRVGKYGDAETEFRRTLALAPELTAMHSNLAWVLALQGRFQEAQQSAQQALLLSDGNLSAHLLLGRLLAGNLATRSQAIEHLEHAAREMPAAEEALRALRDKQFW